MRKKIYSVLSLLMLIMTVVLLVSQWKLIPQSIPAHISFDGTVSGTMNKMVLWGLPALQVLITFLFLFMPVNRKTMKFINIPYKRRILSLDDEQFEKVIPAVSEMLISISLWVNFLFYYIIKLFLNFILKRPIENIRIYVFMISVLLIVLVFYSMNKIKRNINKI